jgi:hypothetical protein
MVPRGSVVLAPHPIRLACSLGSDHLIVDRYRRHRLEHAVAPDERMEKRCCNMQQDQREEREGEIEMRAPEKRLPLVTGFFSMWSAMSCHPARICAEWRWQGMLSGSRRLYMKVLFSIFDSNLDTQNAW